ncbi:MAG TPA: hypothetical protein VKP08_10915 [Anaerolineales bacterium]|nr:hypothetical protein [Anaerolineales bacterium]
MPWAPCASTALRSAQRTIQRELQDPLAFKILSGEFDEGETILVDRVPVGLTSPRPSR